MAHKLFYGTVPDTARNAIYVVRVDGAILASWETDELADRVRERMRARGESVADVVVMQGDSRETFQLLGIPYSVRKVRTALFHAAVDWIPLRLD